jgi:hypothetical protein
MRLYGSDARPHHHLTNDFMMKFFTRLATILSLLGLLCASRARCLALDREAFTFKNYNLNVRLEPEQQRIGVRGKITLRNDSSMPQKIAVLQISSSLDWRSITVGGKQVQFVMQPYTSDIDHTGALSEAIITLPQEVAPHATVELEIGYEGVIPLDTTRLTRIGAPKDAAKSADWDQISPNFTAVRGVGYVAWYPIATESANLSDGDSLFEVLGRWKQREIASQMHFRITVSQDGAGPGQLMVNEPMCAILSEAVGRPQQAVADCTFQPLGLRVPVVSIAPYLSLSTPSLDVYYLPGHEVPAASYAEAARKIVPLITNWFGRLREKAVTAELPDADAALFESGALLLTPLAGRNSELDGLAAAEQLTHAAFKSFRPWIEEGLAHFAQALFLEQEKGRQGALDYMGSHRATLMAPERSLASTQSQNQANRSLINTTDEIFLQSKAMCVWWMLRDMIGDAALKKALSLYRPEQDKEPSYMPRLIQAQTPRDLEWFFDDWVYRDRGLPDFKIESVFSRKAMTGTYVITITVENLGGAGAEVPLIVKFAGGEVKKRLEVRAKSQTTTRMETPFAPEEIVVNDGSVPESDITNNTFKVVTQSP